MRSGSGLWDRRLLRETGGQLWIGAGIGLGLVSAAAIVAQALALATLLADAMGSRTVNLLPPVAWLAAAFAVRAACGFAAELVAVRGAEVAKATLRQRLLGSVLGNGHPSRAKVGEVAIIAGRGLEALDPYFGRCLPDLVLAVAVPLGLTAVIAGLDWISALVILVVLLLFPLFGYLVGASSRDLAERRWRQVESFSAQIADVFEGLPVLKALGHSARQHERMAQAGRALNEASLATLKVAFLSALVLDTLASVSIALIAVPLGLRLLTGSVGLPAALAVLIIAPEVFLPLRRASAEFHESTEGLAAARRAMDAAASLASVHGREAPPDPARATVALHQVRVELAGRDDPVLEGASLVIEPGERVVMMGANGAGKSTTIALLLGFIKPALGSVKVGGRNLGDLDVEAWRRCLAYLPEHPTLLSASLADNLRLAMPEATDEELVDVLRAVGADGLLARLPGRLETRIGEGGRTLSAGERQRIALARTLLRRGSVYLLDEPTAHLDSVSERAVVDTLAERLRGRSALIVTHRTPVLRLADRVIALEGGRFVPMEAKQPVLA